VEHGSCRLNPKTMSEGLVMFKDDQERCAVTSPAPMYMGKMTTVLRNAGGCDESNAR
jgi:hypothetical protein